MAVSMIPGTKYVTFELLLHAAFVANEICQLEYGSSTKFYKKLKNVSCEYNRLNG